MSTFMKVDNVESDMGEFSEFIRKGKSNRTEEQPVITEEVREKFQYKVSEAATNGSSNDKLVNFFVVLLCLCTVLFK